MLSDKLPWPFLKLSRMSPLLCRLPEEPQMFRTGYILTPRVDLFWFLALPGALTKTRSKEIVSKEWFESWWQIRDLFSRAVAFRKNLSGGM